MTLRVEIAGPEHAARLRALFDACASTCFCRYWHFTGTKNEWLERCALRPEENASELERALASGPDETARGLVAVTGDGDVVGWMKLTARAALPKLRALPVYRALDLGREETTFGVGCVLVDPRHRRRGVARALVEAAPERARAWGARAIEAYPRRSHDALHDEEAWQGPERIFVALGWEVVHDVAPYPVYRNVIARAREPDE
jgi:GNAT superfamily N-acetyltransferase